MRTLTARLATFWRFNPMFPQGSLQEARHAVRSFRTLLTPCDALLEAYQYLAAGGAARRSAPGCGGATTTATRRSPRSRCWCRSRMPISCPASAPTCCGSGSSTRASSSGASGRTTASCSARATALLMLPGAGHAGPHPTLAEHCASGSCSARCLGVANWLYDVAAIRAGFLKVYNQPWAEGARAPDRSRLIMRRWFFGGFGLVQGAGLKFAEGLLLHDRGAARGTGYRRSRCSPRRARCRRSAMSPQSYRRHGHHGLPPGPSRMRENDHGELARSRGSSSGWPAIRRAACTMPRLAGIDLQPAVRARGVHAALLHAGSIAACIASIACATTSCSACASTNTS